MWCINMSINKLLFFLQLIQISNNPELDDIENKFSKPITIWTIKFKFVSRLQGINAPSFL